MKKSIAAILILTLLGTVLFGCSAQPKDNGGAAANTDSDTETPVKDKEAPQSTDEPAVIRVGSLSRELAVPFYYMHEMGYDLENGFKIELSAYETGALVNEAQAAGLWDVAAIGAAGVQSMVKYDCVYLYPHQDGGAGTNLIVRPESDLLSVQGYNPDYPDSYGSPETVKGKTIITSIGSGNHLVVSLWLKTLGLTDADVNLVHMNVS